MVITVASFRRLSFVVGLISRFNFLREKSPNQQSQTEDFNRFQESTRAILCTPKGIHQLVLVRTTHWRLFAVISQALSRRMP